MLAPKPRGPTTPRSWKEPEVPVPWRTCTPSPVAALSCRGDIRGGPEGDRPSIPQNALPHPQPRLIQPTRLQ